MRIFQSGCSQEQTDFLLAPQRVEIARNQMRFFYFLEQII